jgi:hypothetical protein
MTSWLDELKVGDEVIEGNYVKKVTAIHKRHIVCGLTKYNKQTGRDITASMWVDRSIVQATEKRRKEIANYWERSNLLSELYSLKYEHVVRKASKETLAKLVEIIKAETEKNARAI